MLKQVFDVDGFLAFEYDDAMVIIYTRIDLPFRLDHLNELARKEQLDHEMFIAGTGQWMIDIDGIVVEYIEDTPGQFRYQRRPSQ
jgi:hypothetical protein